MSLGSIIVPDYDENDDIDNQQQTQNDPMLEIDVDRPWIVDDMELIRSEIKSGDINADVVTMNELYMYETLSAPVKFKVGDRDVEGIILFSFNGFAEIEVKDVNIRGVFQVPKGFLKIVPDIYSDNSVESESESESNSIEK